MGPSIVCLLPARDAAGDLPAYLESAAHVADAVIALDDGSGDDTARLLAAHPLVERLLTNPRRHGYRDWDDGRNRQRLLDTAAERGADWVLYLDADERIDADDAAALREFVASDAIPGFAYGLQLYRCWGDRVVPRPSYVYRLFAPAPGGTLPAQRLHLNPVPAQIPRSAWIRTTIRARHLDSPARLEARRARYAEADPGGELERTPGALREPEAELVEWSPRPAGLPVLVPPEELASLAARPGGDGPLLACLLPARDCESELPGWLDSAAGFADAVVALDDGSTDGTAEVLRSHPLVTRLLGNPRRAGFAGWDDAANRQRLLHEARALGARWAIFLDADERVDPDDAAALRRFAETAADPGAAYGFRVFRMIDDEEHYDRSGLWAYRMFSPAADGDLPAQRLHLVPVPESIPHVRWRRTTVRIKHLASMTRERRAARLDKYEQADPDRFWQPDYSNVVEEPGPVKPWRARPAGLPVLAESASGSAALDLEALDLEAPRLSAIVIARNDAGRIERAVRAVVDQEAPFEFEVIVAVSGGDGTADLVRRRFGDAVEVVEVPEPGLPGAARNAGLARARGDYVSFPGSHVELPPGSLARRAAAHEAGWAMVTGSIHNGAPTPAGWASYFLDHSSSLPGRPSGPLAGAPAHCSYVREFLLEVGGFPEHMRAGEDTVVNQELWRRGHGAYRERAIALTHRSPCTTPSKLCSHHLQRGRALGRILINREGATRRRLAGFLIRYPRRRLADTDERVARWADDPLRERYRRARRLVVLGIAAAWIGSALEVLRPRRLSA